MTQVQWWQVVIFDDTTGSIPPDGVQSMPQDMLSGLTVPVGQGWTLHEGQVRSDTHKVDLTTTPPSVVPYTPAVDLNKLKAKAKKRVDLKAAKLRSWIGSHGYGQESVYLDKAREARDYVVDASPDPANYPFLAAEVGITADDIASVAAAVNTKASEWRALVVQIEATRLATKKAIDEATTEQEITNIETSASWPSMEA